MYTTTARYPASRLLAAYALALAASIALVTPSTATAQQAQQPVTKTIAKGARTCVSTGVCSITPTGKAFGGAVKSMDRLGWEIGRHMSMKKHGPTADPGKYPGLRR